MGARETKKNTVQAVCYPIFSGTNTILLSVLFVLLLVNSSKLLADFVSPSDDLSQSITYWKPYEISIKNNKRVAQAHGVFKQLLRAWDNTRVEPKLYVVKSTSGPWAASLDDGSILLSDKAIEVSFENDANNSKHYLAFILAHELAHQLNEDLWHRKYFRLAAQVSPHQQQQMLGGLKYSMFNPADIEQKEIKADQDALVLMAMVGFDPFIIVDAKDFFSIWVESIWGDTCKNMLAKSDGNEACQQAANRTLRSRSRLRELIAQASLFELGNQFYIAGEYAEAHRYFKAFGREFPGHSIHTNIGLSQLAQAAELKTQLIKMKVIDEPNLQYPILLGSSPDFLSNRARGIDIKDSSKPSIEKSLSQLDSLASEAIRSFDRAININPDDSQNYLHLISSYLLTSNAPMARGILEGKYQRKFGKNNFTTLFSGLVYAVEGDIDRALIELKTLADESRNLPILKSNDKVLFFSLYNNLVAILDYQGELSSSKDFLKQFVKRAQKSDDAALFQLALSRFGAIPSGNAAGKISAIQGFRVGEKISAEISSASKDSIDRFQIEGEQLNLFRAKDNMQVITNNQNIVISIRQTGGQEPFSNSIRVGDPPTNLIKTYGSPSRRAFTFQGEFFAYDGINVAFMLKNNRIDGWYLYPLLSETLN